MAVNLSSPTPTAVPTPEARTELALMQVAVVVAQPAEPRLSFYARNRTVVLFVLLLVAGDFGIGLLAPVWERHSPDDYAARVAGCTQRPRDIVFVGGSPVTEGIDPEVIGGASWRGRPLTDGYAIGLHGGTASDFYYAVRLACPTPPRVLVYGITASDINDSRNEPHGTRALLGPSDVAELVRTRPDAGGWVMRHYLHGKLNQASNVYRYRHGIRMWAVTQAEAIFPGSCPETIREATELREHADDLAGSRGYAPLRGYARIRYDQTKATGIPPPAFNYFNRYRTGSHLKYVYKLADWCRERGVELVLVDMPVTADLETKYAAEFAEYRARLSEVERARGLVVIRDSRAATGLTDEHFADLIHLRPEGCRKLSAWLKAKLEEMDTASHDLRQ